MRPPVSPTELLNALLTGATATAVLEAAYGAPVGIRRQAVQSLALPAAGQAALRPGAEEVRFRRVRLVTAGVEAAEGDLWYVPARLPAEIRAALDASSVPFGALIVPLAPYRQTLSALAGAPGDPVGLTVSALVLARSALPLAYVEERYFVGS